MQTTSAALLLLSVCALSATPGGYALRNYKFVRYYLFILAHVCWAGVRNDIRPAKCCPDKAIRRRPMYNEKECFANVSRWLPVK